MIKMEGVDRHEDPGDLTLTSDIIDGIVQR